jgi:hypothetical protein
MVTIMVVYGDNVMGFPKDVSKFVFDYWQLGLAQGNCVKNQKAKCCSSFHFKIKYLLAEKLTSPELT